MVHFFTSGFVLLEMQVAKVRMFQCLCDSDSLFRVEGEQFLEEIDGIRVCEGKELVEVLAVLLVLRQILDQFFALLRDVLHVLKIRCS